MVFEILYSFAPDEFKIPASVPVLARQDAVTENQLTRYILLENKAVLVRRGGGRDYYFKYNVDLGRNEIVYIDPSEITIFEIME